MKRSLLVPSTTLVCVCALMGTAGGFPIAAPGTECMKVIVSSSDSILATYEGNSATYSNDLYLALDADGSPGDDGNLANDRFIFNNHSSPVGSRVNLGSFTVGTELIFRLFVRNTGNTWYTGPGSRNSDGRCRARVQGNWMQNRTLISFEDHVDFQFNDLSFSFTNTGSVTCPSPSATVGVAYTSGMAASGGIPPYMFSVVGELPAGLALNAATGEIAGVPSAIGVFRFGAMATDANTVVAGADCSISVTSPPVQASQSTWSHIKILFR